MHAHTVEEGGREGREESTNHRYKLGGVLALELFQMRHVGPHEVGEEEGGREGGEGGGRKARTIVTNSAGFLHLSFSR